MFPVLAIAVGGGLGYVVPLAQDATVASQPAPPQVVEPIAPARQPAPPAVAPPASVAEPPPPEIAVQPEPVKPGAVHAAPKGKHKTKPSKSTPCNVYEHMDGC